MDDRSVQKKQRHTAKRIFERLRDEHGFTGGLTIVSDYVREKKRRNQEVFVPLSHAPGHAQVDFGEALGVIGGVERKLHYMAISLPHSDAFFMKAYPAETTEAFCANSGSFGTKLRVAIMVLFCPHFPTQVPCFGQAIEGKKPCPTVPVDPSLYTVVHDGLGLWSNTFRTSRYVMRGLLHGALSGVVLHERDGSQAAKR